MMTMAEMATGARGTVVRVGGHGPIRRRIMDMGIVGGAEFVVESVAPLGDPISIKVKGYHLSLRMEEAAHVQVHPV